MGAHGFSKRSVIKNNVEVPVIRGVICGGDCTAPFGEGISLSV